MSTPEVSRLRSLCSSPSPPLHCLLNSRRRSVLLRRLRAESPSCTTQRQWEGFLVCCSPLASGLHDPPLLAPTDSDGIRYVRAPSCATCCSRMSLYSRRSKGYIIYRSVSPRGFH